MKFNQKKNFIAVQNYEDLRAKLGRPKAGSSGVVKRTTGHAPLAKVAHDVTKGENNKNLKLVPPINNLPRPTPHRKKVM